MSSKNVFLKGTLILTLTGFCTRFIGFFYRIFLSHSFGEEGMGLYQLIFPVYALCFSLTCAGIELSISRCTAKYRASGDNMRILDCLYMGLSFSFLFSCMITFFIQKYAVSISSYFLGDTRCILLLKVIAYALPFAAVHSCIVGYYLGLKQTKLPSISQLLEQCTRILSVFLLYWFLTKNNDTPSIVIAVIGLVFGEIFSSFFVFFHFQKDSRTLKGRSHHYLSSLREVLTLALPLTSNRVLLNILQSVEAVSIPFQLQLYGYSLKESLSLYGVLTGMALPCILFPSAITASVSTMLLPTITEINETHSAKTLAAVTRKITRACLLLGFSCAVFFLLFSHLIGMILFHSENAGKFIFILAWICPFLYTNSTYISILNGVGKTFSSFLFNSLGLFVRIYGVFFLIPRFGMKGYLWGMLLSQILVFILCRIKISYVIHSKQDACFDEKRR